MPSRLAEQAVGKLRLQSMMAEIHLRSSALGSYVVPRPVSASRPHVRMKPDAIRDRLDDCVRMNDQRSADRGKQQVTDNRVKAPKLMREGPSRHSSQIEVVEGVGELSCCRTRGERQSTTIECAKSHTSLLGHGMDACSKLRRFLDYSDGMIVSVFSTATGSVLCHPPDLQSVH